ncbi:MAG: ribosome-associated translation inhibitor RaiA [Coriobacteriia bacterium]|nr:ribosome-associated translation inhibitor RaiA [Coriobacteriia bacterium]
MQVKVVGRHMTVTDPTRAYAEEKFGRLAKIYDAEPVVAEVVLDVRKNRSHPDRFTAEVTVRLKGHVVRAEETSTDMHAAIDLAAAKAEKQMRKYKTKVIDRRNHGVAVTKTAAGDTEIADDTEASAEVVRIKTIETKPMTEEEAVLQLELLGHDFFVFRHADTERVNVLYRRNDGDYGLIQPNA